MEPALYCILCLGGELEKAAPKSKLYTCKQSACPGRFRVCTNGAACLLLPILRAKIEEKKKGLPPLSEPLALFANATGIGEGVLGLGSDCSVPIKGDRVCVMCRKARLAAASAVAAGGDEPQGDNEGASALHHCAPSTDHLNQHPFIHVCCAGTQPPEPEPELQTCLGHLLEDGCTKDATMASGLCGSCDDKFKKQFAAATTFLRWQLELAILGTRPSFTGDIVG